VIVAWADLALGEWDRAAHAAELALREASGVGAAEVILAAERARDDAALRRREGGAVDLLEPPGLARFADGLAGSLQEAVTA
jgi:hypothetical protein